MERKNYKALKSTSLPLGDLGWRYLLKAYKHQL